MSGEVTGKTGYSGSEMAEEKYSEKSKGDSPEEKKGRGFQRVFLEATRLLAWPTPRVYSALEHFKPILGEPYSVLDRPLQIGKGRLKTEGELAKLQATKIKELERYMKPYRNKLESKRRWVRGTAAVHAVPINWLQHEQKKSWLLPQPKDGKEMHGWLLMIGDRSSVNKLGRQEWVLRVRFSVMPGDQYDRVSATKVVAEYVNRPENGVKALHLVTGEDDKPTATVDAEELRCLLPKAVTVEIDMPTKGVGPFTLQPSFPNHRSVENYLAVFLAHRHSFPDSGSDWWRELHLKAADDVWVASQLGHVQLFLGGADGVRRGPG